jgi:hypothetical protein
LSLPDVADNCLEGRGCSGDNTLLIPGEEGDCLIDGLIVDEEDGDEPFKMEVMI